MSSGPNKADSGSTWDDGFVLRCYDEDFIAFPVTSSSPSNEGHCIWVTRPSYKDQYFASQGPPRPIPNLPAPKLVVKPAGNGMGLGVFATEDIKAHELILMERPYIVYPAFPHCHLPKELPEDARSVGGVMEKIQSLWNQTEQQFEAIFNHCMTAEDRAGFMTLANSAPSIGRPITGRLSTNGFSAPFNDPSIPEEFHAAVTRIGSRFNHSCIPNVNQEFHPKTFSMLATASRDIPAGSQLYVSYTDSTMSKMERATFLLQEFGFRCSCKACLNSTPERDELRKTCFVLIQEWEKQLDTVWLKDRGLTSKVLDPLLEVKKRMEDEGLDILRTGYYNLWRIMCVVYQRLGMLCEAQECADKYNQPIIQLAKVIRMLEGPNTLN
ncbi:hypothetical protein CC2G_014826 [Coprinopsis cinerea AmutBmut pab1-1]|nr:hypothetical protein CC2G_014826 [Coprinopsis cinerea AmutBmut pab1-1]